MIRGAITLIALAFLLVAAFAQQPAPAVWMGVGYAAEVSGIRVTSLPYNSPAEKAGLFVNDLIVGIDGLTFDGDAATVQKQFPELITKHRPGDAVTVRVVRDAVTKSTQSSAANIADEEVWRNPEGYLLKQPLGTTVQLTGVHERKTIDIHVVLEERPAGLGELKSYSPPPAIPRVNRPEEELSSLLIDEFKIGSSYKDLRERLAHLSDRGDRFRLSRVAYVQHEPFQLRTVAGNTMDQMAAAVNQKNPLEILQDAAAWLDAAPESSAPRLKTGLTLDQHLDQLVALLNDAQAKREEAFAKLTAEDRKYLEDHCPELFATFSEGFSVLEDPDKARLQRNSRVLDLVNRVDFTKLFEGAELLWPIAQDEYLNDLESALRKAWDSAGKPSGIFITRDSPVGKILVGGNGSSWYTADAAIVLDLGGNDFYTNNAGSPRGSANPAALLIDFAGDDAYEATFDWTQGAAFMGYGTLIDRKGDDEYVGRQWAQGAAALGTSLLLDESGNDVYRADEYAQGAAAWGIAIHLDYDGDDTYEAHLLSQGLGMPGGAGWLLNGSGNDRYYSKGEHPTGYGDPGIFDSWSQGCGVGFRGMQSGGAGLLFDGAGRDRYEAGNFSQGGGYYFGIGMLRDAGVDNDVYIGSRYNQGFAAHEAIGYFEEMGGNDSYTTRQGVAQGIAWDESIVTFVDHAGDDVYEGGEGRFSQGSSAHNGFVLFLDLGGRNRFVFDSPQGTGGPNDYHGGSSFSLFIAAADKGNSYTSKMKPSTIRFNGDQGLFADFPMPVEAALKSKSLIKKMLPVSAEAP